MGSQFRNGFQRLFAVLLLLGASTITAKAQTYLQNVGVPPFTTKVPVENGFINAANGNLHLEIPLGTFPQRAGAPDKIVLMYDSAFWSYAGSGIWQATNISDPNQWAPVWGGWRIVTSRDPGSVTYSEYDYGNCAWAADYTYARYSPWFYVAPDGTQHTFPVTTLMPFYPGHCGNSGTPTAAGYANDGSGFYISITNYTNAVVYAPDGTVLDKVLNNALVSEDTNGNYASYNWVDTLGRTLLKETNSSGVYTLGVPNAQGGTSYYTIRTGPIYVCTAFGQQYVGEWCSPTSPLTITVVNEVDLPDGTKYTFNYDSGTTAGHYGTLTSMTLPTGGAINYTFGVLQDASINSDGSKNKYLWITSRTTPDGAWGYGFQVLSNCAVGYANCQQQFTVTKPIVPPAPSADQTIYTFTLNGGDWPTQVQYNDHASGQLATTTQCFSFVTVTSGSCSYNVTPVTVPAPTNIHLLATTTTLPIPTGNVSATTQYSWDGYGNPTQIQEWNFGNPPTNAADRTTSMTYLTSAAYLPPNANIVNRPTNVTVTNSAGATVAQTLYSYDGGSLSSVTGMPGHDDANYGTGNTVRGNVTLVQQLVSGSTYLNSSITYDMTGQALTSTEPNGAVTTLNYGCANAYPAAIREPLLTNNPIQLGFDCSTGLLTSIADANNQTTSFSYDCLSRPLLISNPDGGQNTIAYNYIGGTGCISSTGTYSGATMTTKINSSQSLVIQQGVDGLSRDSTDVVTSDPLGNTNVKTLYDSNGRVQSVSNPYHSTSDITYGVTQNTYDGLDRVIKVTDQDNSAVNTYYGATVASNGGIASQLCSGFGIGYPILYMDEAGKKRQAWTDGFGRAIEVDEPDSSNNLTASTCYSFDLKITI